jgi:hypothetical protein
MTRAETIQALIDAGYSCSSATGRMSFQPLSHRVNRTIKGDGTNALG